MESRTTQDARREFAALLEDVLRGQHIQITRYDRALAVVVPVDWYEQAKAALESVQLRDPGYLPPRGGAIQDVVRRLHPETGSSGAREGGQS